eukprot:1488479-Rhodomonas_salina.1
MRCAIAGPTFLYARTDVVLQDMVQSDQEQGHDDRLLPISLRKRYAMSGIHITCGAGCLCVSPKRTTTRCYWSSPRCGCSYASAPTAIRLPRSRPLCPYTPPTPNPVSNKMSLRGPYAVSGTNTAYPYARSTPTAGEQDVSAYPASKMVDDIRES